MNKFALFLVSLCLAMFCSFGAYADDLPLEVAAETASETAADSSAVDAPDTPASDSVAAAPDLTPEQLQAILESTLSNGVTVRLDDEQYADLTPETAATIWDKPFNEYTPIEGYALLIFIVVLSACTLTVFRRF